MRRLDAYIEHCLTFENDMASNADEKRGAMRLAQLIRDEWLSESGDYILRRICRAANRAEELQFNPPTEDTHEADA